MTVSHVADRTALGVPMATDAVEPRSLQRYYILDALRGILALCVAIGHLGMFPLFGAVGASSGLQDFLARGWRTAVFGPAAVIAFFVISGFCIHYPFAGNRASCPVGRFYARRYLRILVPVAGTLVLFKLLLPRTVIVGADSVLWHSTLWSIVCEELYYAAYPFILRVALRVGWKAVLVSSWVPAIAICIAFFPAVDWQDIGVFATALTLFPVWLSGCYLADRLPSFERDYSRKGIWRWRAGAWATMWIALVLHSHSRFHQTVSGLIVGSVYYFWLRAEIAHFRTQSPPPLLVWAGAWSYSLYLIHPVALSVGLIYAHLDPSTRTDWVVLLGLILGSSYLFYILVERPSHNLARKIRLVPRTT